MSLLSLVAQNLGGEFVGFDGYQPDVGGAGDPGTSGVKLAELISNVFGFLTIVAGVSFLIYFTMGGLTWITAGGDSGKIDEAKSRMTGGAIGMIIIVSSYGIAWIVSKALGVNFLDPAAEFVLLQPTQ